MSAIFVSFFRFWIIVIFSKEALMIYSLGLYHIVTIEQMHARIKNLRHGFLIERVKRQMRCLSLSSAHSWRDWSWIYTDICFRKKRLKYAISFDFEIFKGMSHNLEPLSFQKTYGLSGFMREMKALQRSARGRSWTLADTLNVDWLLKVRFY